MLEHHLTLLIALHLIRDSLQCETITIRPPLTFFKCKYQYVEVGGTCTFQRCIFDPNGDTEEVMGWAGCFTNCCQPILDRIGSSASGDAFGMLYACRDYYEERERAILGVSLGVGLSVMVLILLLIYCWRTQGCLLYNMRSSNKKKRKRLNKINRDMANPKKLAQKSKEQSGLEEQPPQSFDTLLNIKPSDVLREE